MQGTGNYRSASGPSASACRHAFAPVAGEEVAVRRVFLSLLQKRRGRGKKER